MLNLFKYWEYFAKLQGQDVSLLPKSSSEKETDLRALYIINLELGRYKYLLNTTI